VEESAAQGCNQVSQELLHIIQVAVEAVPIIQVELPVGQVEVVLEHSAQEEVMEQVIQVVVGAVDPLKELKT
jgi:hypothetical protein